MPSRNTGRARLAGLPASQPDREQFRPPPIAVALPDHTTVQIPAVAWAARQLWRAHTCPGGPPLLAVHELPRAQSQALERKWSAGEREPRFGTRAFGLLADHHPVALLIAANPDTPEVNRRLGLVRSNCIELARLCHAPHQHGSDALLLRIWSAHLAVSHWPYYQHSSKVALICYPQRSGTEGTIGKAEGWERITAGGEHGPLWAHWLPARQPASRALRALGPTRQPAAASAIGRRAA